MRVECLQTEEEFKNLKSPWNDLLLQSHANTLFLTWEWGFSWWQTVSNEKYLLQILLIFSENKLVGIAPLVIRKAIMYGFLRLKKVEFIGSELMNGEYLDFITEPGFEEDTCRAVANYLIQNSKSWDVMELYPWPEGSLNKAIFSKECEKLGLKTFSFLRTVCPVVNLPENWECFRNSLKKSLRKKTEYHIRRLEKDHDVIFGKWESIEEINRDLPRFFEIHQQKWQAYGEPGSFVDVRKRLFYETISKRFLGTKWLRVYYLRIDDRIVSILFGIVYNNRFFDLQAAYDLDWQKRSVGTVLLYHSFKQSINEGMREYDFLRGEEEYKYQWGAVPKRNMRILVLKPGFLLFIFKLFRWRKAKKSLSNHSDQPIATNYNNNAPI